MVRKYGDRNLTNIRNRILDVLTHGESENDLRETAMMRIYSIPKEDFPGKDDQKQKREGLIMEVTPKTNCL